MQFIIVIEARQTWRALFIAPLCAINAPSTHTGTDWLDRIIIFDGAAGYAARNNVFRGYGHDAEPLAFLSIARIWLLSWILLPLVHRSVQFALVIYAFLSVRPAVVEPRASSYSNSNEPNHTIQAPTAVYRLPRIRLLRRRLGQTVMANFPHCFPTQAEASAKLTRLAGGRWLSKSLTRHKATQSNLEQESFFFYFVTFFWPAVLCLETTASLRYLASATTMRTTTTA